MNLLTILISVWGIIVAALVAVMVYRGYLSRQESDQLFLNEDSEVPFVHEEQDEVISRINALDPLARGLGGAAIVLTLVVAGMYIVQELPNIRL